MTSFPSRTARHEAEARVHAAAAKRYGILSVAQAQSLGIPSATLRTMAHRGRLHHVSHGVYRLVECPYEGLTELMALCEWPRASCAALGGASAAFLRLTSPEQPIEWYHARILVSMLLPPGYRSHRAPPPRLLLRPGYFPLEQCGFVRGFRTQATRDALWSTVDDLILTVMEGLFDNVVARRVLEAWTDRAVVLQEVDREEAEAVLHDFDVLCARILRRRPSMWR